MARALDLPRVRKYGSMGLVMENPPGKKPSANATIQIDRVDLNEMLLLDNPDDGAPPAASVPPPLPPEELARAASLAPIGSIPPATAAGSGRGAWLAVGFVAVLAIAIGAGVLVGNAVRSNPQPVSAASSQPATSNAPSNAGAQATAPATQTITIHTMELGGKETPDE
ncbi:MAG: hypothetical protein ABI183_14315 [Polyangiaceae bacterium]